MKKKSKKNVKLPNYVSPNAYYEKNINQTYNIYQNNINNLEMPKSLNLKKKKIRNFDLETQLKKYMNDYKYISKKFNLPSKPESKIEIDRQEYQNKLITLKNLFTPNIESYSEFKHFEIIDNMINDMKTNDSSEQNIYLLKSTQTSNDYDMRLFDNYNKNKIAQNQKDEGGQEKNVQKIEKNDKKEEKKDKKDEKLDKKEEKFDEIEKNKIIIEEQSEQSDKKEEKNNDKNTEKNTDKNNINKEEDFGKKENNNILNEINDRKELEENAKKEEKKLETGNGENKKEDEQNEEEEEYEKDYEKEFENPKVESKQESIIINSDNNNIEENKNEIIEIDKLLLLRDILKYN